MIKVLDHGFVELVDSMPAVDAPNPYDIYNWGTGDARVVESARVSFSGHNKTRPLDQDQRLLKYLMRNKHWSPFEQVKLTFRVRAPIFVIRQWHRHRTWQYNEVSARYTKMADDFYVPKLERMQGQSKDNKQASGDVLPERDQEICRDAIEEACEEAYSTYLSLLARGLSREVARIVLPVGLYTEMFASVDLRNLLGFLSLRDHGHAQWEMVQYAKALRELAKPVAPYTFQVASENL